jgi:hypothetical protein
MTKEVRELTSFLELEQSAYSSYLGVFAVKNSRSKKAALEAKL